MTEATKSLLKAALAIALLWLGVRFLLPVLLPFLLGGLLALAAEPLVRLQTAKLHLNRTAATALGVTASLALLLGLLTLVGAFAVRQLSTLANRLPEAAQAARDGVDLLSQQLMGMADNAPAPLRPGLQRMITDTFDGSGVFFQQLTQKLPSALSATVGKLGTGALGVGTGVLSAYLISARLPKLQAGIKSRLPANWESQWKPGFSRVKTAVGGWLKAQLKLSGLTFCVVTTGLLLLRIPLAPLWGLLTAIVDAVPILGTGTVLIPWSVICLLQNDPFRAVGLLITFGCALLLRTTLEPRLVGQQLGLDPLTTLLMLYLGFRFWGVPGLLLAPILASAAKALLKK